MAPATKSSRTAKTIATLRQRIGSEPTKVGDKLPTEKQLCLEFGVSRTVIREAVAALRADGLLDVRHGVGVFVAALEARNTSDPGELMINSSALDLLELRIAVEIHAVALAATRRSWAQEEKIWLAADTFTDAVAKGEPTEDADVAFHRAIAEATNNPAFVEFLHQLGQRLLPRLSLPKSRQEMLITRPYLKKSSLEHQAICEAITRADADAARESMTKHLGGSYARYRLLAQATVADPEGEIHTLREMGTDESSGEGSAIQRPDAGSTLERTPRDLQNNDKKKEIRRGG
jgi:GntR family transcriptional regulator, transcriptional repressor for pyruvate dehydrogenase complex